MAVPQPPVTGDAQTDSFNLRVAQELNNMAPAIAQASASSGEQGTPGSNGLNTATIILFQRSVSLATEPTNVPSANVYEFNPPAFTTTLNNGWTLTIPDESEGAFLWTTSTNIASGSATAAVATSAWSAITLFSVPGDDGLDGFSVITDVIDVIDVDDTSVSVQVLSAQFGTLEILPQLVDSDICWVRLNTVVPDLILGNRYIIRIITAADWSDFGGPASASVGAVFVANRAVDATELATFGTVNSETLLKTGKNVMFSQAELGFLNSADAVGQPISIKVAAATLNAL